MDYLKEEPHEPLRGRTAGEVRDPTMPTVESLDPVNMLLCGAPFSLDFAMP